MARVYESLKRVEAERSQQLRGLPSERGASEAATPDSGRRPSLRQRWLHFWRRGSVPQASAGSQPLFAAEVAPPAQAVVGADPALAARVELLLGRIASLEKLVADEIASADAKIAQISDQLPPLDQRLRLVSESLPELEASLRTVSAEAKGAAQAAVRAEEAAASAGQRVDAAAEQAAGAVAQVQALEQSLPELVDGRTRQIDERLTASVDELRRETDSKLGSMRVWITVLASLTIAALIAVGLRP